MRMRTQIREPGGMWRRIEVRNYRSIERVSADVAPFTVVVGPNGSGKSNFADAFVFARDMANDASTAVQNRGGIVGVRRWRPSRPADVTIDVKVAASREGLDTDFTRHSFTLASKREGKWEFKPASHCIAAIGLWPAAGPAVPAQSRCHAAAAACHRKERAR